MSDSLEDKIIARFGERIYFVELGILGFCVDGSFDVNELKDFAAIVTEHFGSDNEK